MWGKPTEVQKLIALRKNAREVLKSAPPVARNIRLTLCVHVGPRQAAFREPEDAGAYAGDLDNFIGGVCDGLGKGYESEKPEVRALWENEETSIQPAEPVAIEDDSKVVEILAKRIVGLWDEPWYDIKLEGALWVGPSVGR